MSKELKPCPFCGGEAVFHYIKGNRYHCWVECENGDADVCMFSNDELAIKRWNTRPNEEALKAENERLREKLENVKKHLVIHRDHAIQSYRQDGKAYRVMNDFLARFCNNLLKVINTDTEKGEKDNE